MSEAIDLVITRLGPEEHERAYATLLSAFSDDPVERWLYPATEDYLEHFPRFLKAFGGKAFEAQTAWGLPDLSAVALWLPPGVEADGEAIVSHLTETVDPSRHDDMYAVLEQMDEAHPSYAHWYLPWCGVDPARQGAGLGSRLLAHCLEVVDAARLPAYLETPNPRTVPFYARHGFAVTGEARAGSCPPMTFMLRAAA
jgi:GNAT superfamily N-acetyltransferase